MKFFSWFKGFFEDQNDGASSKRAVLFWAMGLLTYMTIKATKGVVVNMEIYWGIVGLVLAGLGMVTSEFFKSKSKIEEEITNKE
jgi:hypothetical protein